MDVVRDDKFVLVTGGAGYIGSHTSVELLNAGYKVLVVDNLENSEERVLTGIREITGKEVLFEKKDCRDREDMEEVFEKYNFGSIIHFAAYKAVGESVIRPIRYYRNNVLSLVNLMAKMRNFKLNNLVFSSSCTVYGQPDHLPVTEETPRKEALSPYGNTKQFCEDIIRDAGVAYPGMIGIALRYFNPIGAHPSALIGELPKGEPNNLVPYITQTAAGVREQLKVFGNDYNTPDRSPIRDYINVVDLAKAHVAAMDRIVQKKNKTPYEYFNVGTGQGVSVLQLVQTFEKATGVKVNYEVVGRRLGDVERIYADTTFANKELGWEATTSLEDTLVSAWNWEKKVRGLE